MRPGLLKAAEKQIAMGQAAYQKIFELIAPEDAKSLSS